MKKIDLAAYAAKNSNNGNVNGMNNNANEAAPVQPVQPVQPTGRNKRSYKPQPVYQVIRMAHKMFDHQFEKNDETKVRSLEEAVAQASNLYPDDLVFFLEFKAERDRLLDSVKFSKACKEKGLNPECVADHIVFEGKTVLEMVLKEGVASLGQMVMMFRKPLFHDEKGLYSSNKSSEEVAND